MTTPKTATMNHAQRQYALQRVTEVTNRLVNAIDEKYTSKFTLGNLIKGIKNGSIKPDEKLDYEIKHYTDVNDVFKVKKRVISALGRAKRDEVQTLHQRASDTIMLGDCEVGLKIIADLEAFKI